MKLLLATLCLAPMMLASAAQADSIDFSIHSGGNRGYYAPAPIYVAPRPVIVRAAPVYYQPTYYTQDYRYYPRHRTQDRRRYWDNQHGHHDNGHDDHHDNGRHGGRDRD